MTGNASKTPSTELFSKFITTPFLKARNTLFVAPSSFLIDFFLLQVRKKLMEHRERHLKGDVIPEEEEEEILAAERNGKNPMRTDEDLR